MPALNMSSKKYVSKSFIAITMGDPAGIGGEVTLKALNSLIPRSKSRYLLLGDYQHWIYLAKKYKFRYPLICVNEPGLPREIKKGIAVLDLGGAPKVVWGKVSAACGAAAIRYINEGAKLALVGKVKALVTAPISKEAIHQAGCPFPGHTELLAQLSHTKSFAMM